jgi:hypothetical protein
MSFSKLFVSKNFQKAFQKSNLIKIPTFHLRYKKNHGKKGYPKIATKRSFILTNFLPKILPIRSKQTIFFGA